MKSRHHYASIATLALFLLSTTWLLGPNVNHLLVRGPNLASEYESVGMPFAAWFRMFDACAALSLCIILYIRRKSIIARFNGYIFALLATVPVLQLIDVFNPLKCVVEKGICSPVNNFVFVVHNAESFLLSLVLIVLSCFIALKNRRYIWLPTSVLLCTIASAIADTREPRLLFAFQTATLLLNIYGIWIYTLEDIFQDKIRTRKFSIRHIIAVIVAMSTIVGITDSFLHVSRHIRINELPFTSHTAWFSQHTILVSLALMYVARSLWHGSLNAWRLTIWLTFIEVVRTASFGEYERTLMYMLIFVLVITSRPYFTVVQNFGGFKKRLTSALLVIVATTVSVTILSVTFRYVLTRQWEASAFTPARVVSRVLLLEVRSDPHDPLRARLYGQVLTSIGSFMYAWLFLGLFLPVVLHKPKHDEPAEGIHDMRELLKKYSKNSEDYFKLWPYDKQYWVSESKKSAVAYAQKGSFLIALADPITAPQHMSKALEQFEMFAHNRGAKPAWLMVDQARIHAYDERNYTSVAIGASAVVNLQTYADETVRTKWWRWKRNKAVKQGLTYETLLPPHNTAVLDRITVISNEWIKREGHAEHGFALGYFDEKVLEHHILHVLKNNDGRIVAFANQLPTSREISITSIDLMRYMPEYTEAMAYLLSETLLSLQSDSTFTHFDLGFVPLALAEETKYKKAVLVTLKRLIQPIFSSKGLEQFKNKFEPDWRKNYLTFEGDFLDVPKLLKSVADLTKR